MKIINFKNELTNLPEGLKIDKSNAFPWITKLENVEYLTFRSAPSHFPNNNSRIIVLKRQIGTKKWELEHTISMNKDLREPRVVNFKGRLLYLYFCALQRFAFFKPESIMISEKIDGKWTDSKETYEKGFMVYSVKEIDGVLYMTCYNKKQASECYFLKSVDSVTWENVFPNGNIHKYLTCETDFIIKDQNYYFVSRNEFGKFNKYGSEIFKFSSTGKIIKHVHSKLKFDGPFLFDKKGEIFLVARKNIANNGEFLLSNIKIKYIQYWISNLYYWFTSKKTGVWKLNNGNLETRHVMDLPSNGDTSYASVQQNKGKTKIYYYSSPLNPVKSWVQGQIGKTSIYSVELKD